ncbi:BDN_1c_G0035650.mRNA.1.CDS.1 [Saccharomyces cerevisiae]|nr:BDN_1c_G0035650.mRNA.1.CDS.1 [Saccharomyces cerevisiae]CAI7207543.1 BDN_1c_G0035650.mRNA.1.CDS.1 [Saccharomyces cerevisiae]
MININKHKYQLVSATHLLHGTKPVEQCPVETEKQPSKIHETAPRLDPEGPFNGRPLQARSAEQTTPQHHSTSLHEQQ